MLSETAFSRQWLKVLRNKAPQSTNKHQRWYQSAPGEFVYTDTQLNVLMGCSHFVKVQVKCKITKHLEFGNQSSAATGLCVSVSEVRTRIQTPPALHQLSFMTPQTALHHPHCELSSSDPHSSLLTLPAYFTHLSAPAVCWWVVVHTTCTPRPAWDSDHSRALTCAGAAPWLPPPNACPINRHANSFGIKNITDTHTYRNTANGYLQTTHTHTYTAINTDTLLNTHWAIYTGLAAHASQLKASQRVCACVCVCV